MPVGLTFSLSAERLDAGSPEELATFGMLTIDANGRFLTVGVDTDTQELRRGPHVPGYSLAEWLAWNWWRIRWEYCRPTDAAALTQWELSHRLASIGEGYSWPNITIHSDGMCSFIVADHSVEQDGVLFRYLGGQRTESVSCIDLENAIEAFVEQVLSRLDGLQAASTNLHQIWAELRVERADIQLARFRRFEALLGYDPDEADENMVRRHLDTAEAFGDEAFGDMAADAAAHGRDRNAIPNSEDLHRIAELTGFAARPADSVRLPKTPEIAMPGTTQAWRLGENAAKLLRRQEGLNGQPIRNERLAQFAGTSPTTISAINRNSEHCSFALDEGDGRSRIALRPNRETSRRFELARLIGDRLLNEQENGSVNRLFPVTRTYSYRQKAQRAFAAELLSPFDWVSEMLAGDYSEERQYEVADHFEVSPMTIQTQLLNGGCIERDQAPELAGRGAAR